MRVARFQHHRLRDRMPLFALFRLTFSIPKVLLETTDLGTQTCALTHERALLIAWVRNEFRKFS